MKLRRFRSFAELPTWILIPAILYFGGAAGFFGINLVPGWAAWLEMKSQLGWNRQTVAIGVMLACASIACRGFLWVAGVLQKGLNTRLHA